MPAAPQRIMPPSIPAEIGTTPIPEGTVRFNHFTWGAERAHSIAEHGIQQSYSIEKYKHGGTESPQVFANAGVPGKNDMPNRGDKYFIEGYAKPEQLDIGRPYGHERLSNAQLGEHMRGLEERRSTITMHGDIPPSQIVGVHEPWHQTYRYLRDNPEHEAPITAGNYDDTEPELDKAMEPFKISNAAKVMLGGKLEGKAYK